MLVVRHLSRDGLAPTDLDVADGEAVAVLGPSGSGKTLLLRAIADLDPNEGDVSLDGQSREAMSAPTWRRKVTYLAAEPGWWGTRPITDFADPDAARAVLPRLGLDPAMLERPITELSTGERHRLALARVLVQAPRVLLLDEPTSGLDQDTTHTIESVLRAQLETGASALFSTHDEALAGRLASRLIRIREGRIQEAVPA